MGRVQDKVIIVTGGAQGIGEATVRRLHEEGAKVVITDLNAEKGQALADELGGETMFIQHDVSKAEEWDRVLAEVDEKFGKVDVLVNNAGVSVTGKFGVISDEDYMKNININQHSVFYGTKRVKPLMDRAGGGSIINFSSLSGLVGSENGAGYNTSKFAVRGMTKVAALDYVKDNIRVNSVHPGVVLTPILAAVPDDYMPVLEAAIPMGRLGRPEEIANVVLFLASDESSYCTGAEFICDGGFTTQ